MYFYLILDIMVRKGVNSMKDTFCVISPVFEPFAVHITYSESVNCRKKFLDDYVQQLYSIELRDYF